MSRPGWKAVVMNFERTRTRREQFIEKYFSPASSGVIEMYRTFRDERGVNFSPTIYADATTSSAANCAHTGMKPIFLAMGIKGARVPRWSRMRAFASAPSRRAGTVRKSSRWFPREGTSQTAKTIRWSGKRVEKWSDERKRRQVKGKPSEMEE